MLPEHGVDPAVLVISTVLVVVGAVSSLNHVVFQVVLPEHGVDPAVLVIPQLCQGSQF